MGQRDQHPAAGDLQHWNWPLERIDVLGVSILHLCKLLQASDFVEICLRPQSNNCWTLGFFRGFCPTYCNQFASHTVHLRFFLSAWRYNEVGILYTCDVWPRRVAHAHMWSEPDFAAIPGTWLICSLWFWAGLQLQLGRFFFFCLTRFVQGWELIVHNGSYLSYSVTVYLRSSE